MEKINSNHGIKDLNENPAIFISTSKKNASNCLAGEWIDLTTFDTYDELEGFCKEMYKNEPNPRFLILDFENFPKAWYHEKGLPTKEEFNKIKTFAQLNKEDKEAYEIFLEEYDSDANYETFKDRYMGKYDTGEEFAQDFIYNYVDVKNIPSIILDHIDWTQMWQTLRNEYDNVGKHYYRLY